MMDNFDIDITSTGRESLELAIQLAWIGAGASVASHYKICKIGYENHHGSTAPCLDPKGVESLILSWATDSETLRLPFPLGQTSAMAFAQEWLSTQKIERHWNFDGDCGEGWRLFNNLRGNIPNSGYPIFVLQPVVALYGK